MERYAQIPIIPTGVVFSDPFYDESVWCQYRKDFRADNWLMKMDSKTEDGIISFTLTLGRSTVLSGVQAIEVEDGIQINYPGRYNTENFQLGMDTACIYCGLKEHWVYFPNEAGLRTGTDGFFGDLTVFTCKGEEDPAGFLMTADLDATFMNEKLLFAHFVSSFNGKEITPEMYAGRINPNSLEVKLMESAELRHAMEAKQSKDPNIHKENER